MYFFGILIIFCILVYNLKFIAICHNFNFDIIYALFGVNAFTPGLLNTLKHKGLVSFNFFRLFWTGRQGLGAIYKLQPNQVVKICHAGEPAFQSANFYWEILLFLSKG